MFQLIGHAISVALWLYGSYEYFQHHTQNAYTLFLGAIMVGIWGLYLKKDER